MIVFTELVTIQNVVLSIKIHIKFLIFRFHTKCLFFVFIYEGFEFI